MSNQETGRFTKDAEVMGDTGWLKRNLDQNGEPDRPKQWENEFGCVKETRNKQSLAYPSIRGAFFTGRGTFA